MQILQHVLKTVMGIKNDEEVESFSHWMSYRGFDNFTDICVEFYHILDSIHDYSEYKVNGLRCSLKFSTMNKIRLFINWMATKMTDDNFELYAVFLMSLTTEQFNNFRQEDMKRLYNMSRPSHNEPHTPMTTFTGHTKSSATSESQTALNNFKRGTKRDESAYPIFKNDLYYDTFQRSFLAIIKAQGLYDVADPDFDPDDGDHYEQELFQEKQSFVYSVLVTSLQTDKGRELVKEFEGDSRSILSKLHHYHTQSNVAQHEVVTLTTYTTNPLTAGKEQPDNSSVISKKDSDCLTVLSLILTRFQKL